MIIPFTHKGLIYKKIKNIPTLLTKKKTSSSLSLFENAKLNYFTRKCVNFIHNFYKIFILLILSKKYTQEGSFRLCSMRYTYLPLITLCCITCMCLYVCVQYKRFREY